MVHGLPHRRLAAAALVCCAFALAGCNSSSSGASGGAPTTTSTDTNGTTAYVPPSGTTDTGLLFPTYSNAKAGYSFVYPGGWRIKETGTDVRIARFGNAITAVVRKRPTAPYYKGYQKQLEAMLAKHQDKIISKIDQPASQVKFGDQKAVMAVIEQVRPTGPGDAPKDTLVAYRYLFWKDKNLLLLSLSSVKGIDNAAAWNLIANSVKWQ